MAVLGARVRELPVLMGRHKSLAGIFTEPLRSCAVTDPPTVVLLNAGIVHRVGPNRMHVLLARALAAAGVSSLRFDMSGIGDSPSRSEATAPLESAMSDIRDAMEWLERNKRIGKVVLFGLCSGADHSILYASSDRRVVGTILLDPNIPRTRKYYLYRSGAKLTSLVRKSPGEALSTLGKYFNRGLSDELADNRSPSGELGDLAAELTDSELHAFFVGHYRECVEAGVQIMVVTTGGEQGRYGEQILDAFPDIAFGDRLTLEHLSRSDHTFTREADRDWLAVNLQKWMMKCGFASVTYSAV
jgi:dienelactone hydrolase